MNICNALRVISVTVSFVFFFKVMLCPLVLNMSLNKTKILIMTAISKTLKTTLCTRNEKTAFYCKLFAAISLQV